jgi:GTPase SAR1 family protein
VVYDITKRRTFEHVPDWIEEAEANLGGPDPSQLVFLLVGHKADLEGKREVLYEEGEYLAKHRKIKFVETSALTGENVNVSKFINPIINNFYYLRRPFH